MHCASCEILIQRQVQQLTGAQKVHASLQDGQVTIEGANSPDLQKLNRHFTDQGYLFTKTPPPKQAPLLHINAAGQLEISAPRLKALLLGIGTAIALIAAFFLLGRTPLMSLVNVDSTSSLTAFILFGLVAGTSSCAALVGGLLLALSKKWTEETPQNTSFARRARPYLLFNAGRLAGFALFGALLGAAGQLISLSIGLNALLIIVVSLVMTVISLQMLGVQAALRVRLALPRLTDRFSVTASGSPHPLGPLMTGAATFFLPCGFTLAAQALALASGSPLSGALIMGGFALGTLPMLIALSLTSTHANTKPRTRALFQQVAGWVILFLALYNINAQLVLLNLPNLNDLQRIGAQRGASSVTLADGVQLIVMQATASGYQPNTFQIQAGIPVRWEVTNSGAAGCANVLVAPGLFDGYRQLPTGTTVIDFTPAKTGTYRFSCSMGHYTGIVQVI